jgi:hypothetical protein
MNKFLKLCEQFDPSNQDTQEAALWIKQVLSEAEIPFSGDGDIIKIPTEYGVATLKVISFEKDSEIGGNSDIEEEDEQIQAGYGTINVMDRMRDMRDEYKKKGVLGKVVNPTLRQATKIADEMDKLGKEMIPAGKKALERAKKDLAKIKQSGSRNAVTY